MMFIFLLQNKGTRIGEMLQIDESAYFFLIFR